MIIVEHRQGISCYQKITCYCTKTHLSIDDSKNETTDNFQYGRMLSLMDKMFSEWLAIELEKREWSPARLARVANISRTAISNILSGTRRAGPDVCKAIARAFNLPQISVFVAAGLLDPIPDQSSEVDELVHCFQQLNQADRNELIEIARLKAARGKK